MARRFAISTLLTIGLIYSLYQESKSTLSLSAYQPLISCLLIIVCIVIYCSTKGISLIQICRNVVIDDDLQLAFDSCCNTSYRVAYFCATSICIFISFVVTTLANETVNTHTSQIVELISGAMIFMSLIILCDQLIASSLGKMLFIDANYSLKLWLLWQIIVFIGSIDKFIVVCPVLINSCRHFNTHSWSQISIAYYLPASVFLIGVAYKSLFNYIYMIWSPYYLDPSNYHQIEQVT